MDEVFAALSDYTYAFDRTGAFTYVSAADGSVEAVIARVCDVPDRPRTEEVSEPARPPASDIPESIPGGFVWQADITEEGDRLHWDLRMDEATAQRVFPLDQEPGQSYASACAGSRACPKRCSWR